MNGKLIAVITLGIIASAVLLFFPPWISDGVHRGHSFLLRTAFMTIDRTRLIIEEIGIIGITTLVAVLLRKRGDK